MRIWLVIIIVVLFAMSGFAADQRVARHQVNNTVEWDKRINAGATSYFAYDIDTVLITGASDSLYSWVYEVPDGDVSILGKVSGGTTQSFTLSIMVANRGSRTAYAIPDSEFVHLYSVGFAGEYADNMTTETSQDSIEQTGEFFVLLPPLNADVFKFAIHSGVTQSGNTTVVLYMKRGYPLGVRY